jgi:hypothetical protein
MSKYRGASYLLVVVGFSIELSGDRLVENSFFRQWNRPIRRSMQSCIDLHVQDSLVLFHDQQRQTKVVVCNNDGLMMIAETTVSACFKDRDAIETQHHNDVVHRLPFEAYNYSSLPPYYRPSWDYILGTPIYRGGMHKPSTNRRESFRFQDNTCD